MKAWMRGMTWVGLIVALALVANRGQALPGEIPACGMPPPWTAPAPSPDEPPMADAPRLPQTPASPCPPFTPPPPTPLPPEQAAPFVPGMPLPAAEPMEPAIPVVRLRVRAPARVEPDKEIEYRLTVENVSRADAHHVLVRDRLPGGVEGAVRAEPKCTEQKKTKDGLTDLLWELGTLKAGEHKTIVLTIKPNGSEDVQNRAYVQFEHGQQVTTRVAKPNVRVKVTVPAQAIRYESIPFRIEVVNSGAIPLRNVVLTDELPPGLEFVSGKPEPSGEKPLTWKLGDLPRHQTRRIDYQVISKQTGTFRDKVKVTADGGVSESASSAVAVGEAKLQISISGPQRRLANRPIPYHITVRNLGTVPLTNVQVSDELPGGVEFVSANVGGRREGGFVRWSLGTLSPGEVRSLLLVLRAPKPGWCWNEAAVRAVRSGAERRNEEVSDKARSETTRIESASAPVIEIDKETDWLVVGQKATYTIHLFNPGKNNVPHPSVVVAVPDEMSIRGQRGPTTGQQQGQLVRFDPLKVLDAGEEKTYVVEVEAKKAGEAKLRAWWTDGRQENGPAETWEDRTIVLDPAGLANRVASGVQNYRARYLLGALTQHLLGALMRPRLPCWIWADD